MKKFLLLGLLPALLSGCSDKVEQRVLPDQAFAVLIPPTAPATPQYLSLQLAKSPEQGSLRLWVVNSVPSALGRPTPGDSVLLPPLTLLPAQLQAHGSGALDFPITQPGWSVPKRGAFLVAECHPTKATDQPIAITVADRNSANPLTQVVLRTASNENQVLPAAAYPTLLVEPVPTGLTYVRMHPTTAWHPITPAPFTLCITAAPPAQ